MGDPLTIETMECDPEWLSRCRGALTPLHDLLCSEGITRGLVGPREAERMWSRHLDNCALPADPTLPLVPADARVVDLGSGAGLPGLVWALVRPDLTVSLVEPLERRCAFLLEAVEALGASDRVTVHRGRAQNVHIEAANVVTARAVANLKTLVGWADPHLRSDGRLVAFKGQRAGQEAVAASDELAKRRMTARLVEITSSTRGEDATVVVVERSAG